MKIDMKNLIVSFECMFIFILFLIDGQYNVVLEEIIINGKCCQKVYLCGLVISCELFVGIVIFYNKREVFNYVQVIFYEFWMVNVLLNLVENLCGCGNNEEMFVQELIINDVFIEVKCLSVMILVVVYIQLIVEVVKNCSEQYEVYFDFFVSKVVIQLEFMNNYKELMNIYVMFDKIQNDKNLIVIGISIEGFVLLEGLLKFNE